MPSALITRGDLDGFFGLFIDNLLQLMLIFFLCGSLCGFPTEFILSRVLPACALSILVGNLFYAWQARRLMQETGRDDVTALPYGINTPAVFAFILLVMMPVYLATKDFKAAWAAGVFACFGSAVIEMLGAFVAPLLSR